MDQLSTSIGQQDGLPKFDRPPVVETVMSVQYERLAALTTPYVGWFWKSQLVEDWPLALEAPVVEDNFELFGRDKKPITASNRVSFRQTHDRIQLISSDEARMVQIQNTRFAYNWRKREGTYPSFDVLSREFDDVFGRFRAFCKTEEIGEISPNQWEITYVNLIPKGEEELWNSPDQITEIFPWFRLPAVDVKRQNIENAQGHWTFIIGSDIGRLYITMTPALVDGNQRREAIRLQLMARGPISSTDEDSVREGFLAGHYAIVNSFASMTSEVAHKHWRRKN